MLVHEKYKNMISFNIEFEELATMSLLQINKILVVFLRIEINLNFNSWVFGIKFFFIVLPIVIFLFKFFNTFLIYF